MKKIYKNMILGTTVAVASSSIAVVSLVPSKLKQSNPVVRALDLLQANEVRQRIQFINSQKVVSLKSIKKSFKMTVNLYRGGDFDFSNVVLPFIKNKILSHDEFINVIDNLTPSSATSLRLNFANIKFKKKFFTSPNYLYEINLAIRNNADLPTLKDTLIKEYIEKQDADHTTYSPDTRTEEVLSYSFDEAALAKYKSHISYIDGSTELSESELRAKINAFSSIKELTDYISISTNEPVFTINLSDELLLKYDSINTSDSYESTANFGDDDISVFFDQTNHDDIYGNMNDWTDFDGFEKVYFWNNVFSPLVNFWDKKENGSYFSESHKIRDSKVIAQSIDYTIPLNYAEILNYKPDNLKIHKPLISLNTNRYLENKIHPSQSARFGVEEFSNIDVYKETMFRDWNPHFKQQFFSMWQYTNAYVEWGGNRNAINFPMPSKIDVAHKNGVKAYATLFNDESSPFLIRLMSQREGDTNYYIKNLVQALLDRGVDGLLWNAEIGSWNTNGMTDALIVNYQQFLRDADKAFRDNGLIFQQYSNTNVEIPTEVDQNEQFLNSRFGVRSGRFSDKNSVRFGQTAPGSFLLTMHHYDHNFNIIDDRLGIGADNDLFLGFVDKRSIPFAVPLRLAFAKNHPEYTMTIMGWNSPDGGRTQEWLWKEWAEIQSKKLATEYYANYAEYGSAQAHSGETEWEIGTYTSRKDAPKTVGMVWQDDFNEQREWSLAHDDVHGSLPEGKTNPIWIYEALSRDPRTTSKAYSNLFQEKSPLSSDHFMTSFELGYGNSFAINGAQQFSKWSNVSVQDFMPSYRYIIDEFDASGTRIDLAAKNYIGRKVEAHIDDKASKYFGSDSLHYTGSLKPKEAFENKLYITNIQANKQFKMLVSTKMAQSTQLAIWKNKQGTASRLSPSSIKAVNQDFSELTFDVTADAQNAITSFGVAVQNNTTQDMDLSDLVIDGMSYNSGSSKDHNLTRFSAESNNVDLNGANVTFEDSAFDENTRYVVRNEAGAIISVTSRPEFHIAQAGRYTVEVMNPMGQVLKTKNINIKNGVVSHA